MLPDGAFLPRTPVGILSQLQREREVQFEPVFHNSSTNRDTIPLGSEISLLPI